MTANYRGHASVTSFARREFGLTPRELRVMLAVMSHERVFGYGPLRREIEQLIGPISQTYPLTKGGWIVTSGTRKRFAPLRFTATPDAWERLGFEPPLATTVPPSDLPSPAGFSLVNYAAVPDGPRPAVSNECPAG